MKQSIRYILFLFSLLIVLFCFAVFFVIPKAVALTLPYRWDNLPIGQKKFIVHQYLGEPADTNMYSSEARGEKWIAKRNNGDYELTIFYADSLAANYRLVFNYHFGFFHKTYFLKSKS